MPLSEAKSDALAQVYARSLFELAEAKGGREGIEEVSSEIEEILEIARGDAKFAEFLSSRVLASEARAASLRKIFEGRVSQLTLNFLLTLNQKGRLEHLPAIGAALDDLAQERFGRVEVDVFTAAPIGPDEVRTIRERLGAVLHKEVVVHPYTDATLIGGMRLRVGDKLIDGSVATRLAKLRDRLASEGSAEVRSRFDRMIDG
ncbi:MAG: ATP synthase F1 subunit delta [Phycisphaerales bacterium]|jgi:F-type H+-transporting ATPase subunit delta|nr:ATP synthase F1 subunit delta [Phycisphaerales bacterium]